MERLPRLAALVCPKPASEKAFLSRAEPPVKREPRDGKSRVRLEAGLGNGTMQTKTN